MAISAGRFRSGSFNRRTTNTRVTPAKAARGTTLRELQLQAQLAGVATDRVSDAADVFGLARVDNSGYTVIPDYLEPIGDSGFYVTPNEPVDPTDCERYPNSFWCGGGPVVDGTGDLGVDVPVAGIGLNDIVTNGSETCVTVDMSFFLLPIAPYTACYRNPDARPLPARPEPAPAPPEGDNPEQFETQPQWTPFHFPGTGSGCTHIAVMQHARKVNGILTPYTKQSTSQTQPYIYGYPYGYYSWRGCSVLFPNSRPCKTWYILIYARTPEGTIRGYEYFFDTYANNNQEVEPTVIDIYPVQLVGEPACIPDPAPSNPAPPYRPTGEPMCNCEETNDLLRLIAKRLGTDNYPVTVPASLIDNEDSTEEQQSLTELTAWTIRQMDALIGQFPIEIEIKDADPSQSGDQARKVTVPNLAEGIAELLGLNIKTSVNSDIHTSFLMRLAAEVIATKNAALVTQDYAKANASYLGYKGNTIQRKVNYAFNVTKLDRLESILSESEKSIIGWQDEDKNTVQAYLEKLMFAAGIIKQAFFRPNSEQDKLLEQISNVLGLAQDSEAVEENWREFLKAINNPEDRFNLNSPIIPKVTDSDIELEEEGDI